MLCAKKPNTDTDFKLQLSGGLLSSRVNHSLPMNTSNWVKAFVFGCGSEGEATGETLLAFVIRVLKERKPCNRVCTCGHPKTRWVTSPGSNWGEINVMDQPVLITYKRKINLGLFVYLK